MHTAEAHIIDLGTVAMASISLLNHQIAGECAVTNKSTTIFTILKYPVLIWGVLWIIAKLKSGRKQTLAHGRRNDNHSLCVYVSLFLPLGQEKYLRIMASNGKWQLTSLTSDIFDGACLKSPKRHKELRDAVQVKHTESDFKSGGWGNPAVGELFVSTNDKQIPRVLLCLLSTSACF